MISDDERRAVARRLRGNAAQDMGWLIPWAVFNDAEQHAGEEVVQRLADLIEPPARCPHYMYPCCRTDAGGDYIDRDTLLVLADELQFEQPMGRTDYETVGKLMDAMDEAARRIREALGVVE